MSISDAVATANRFGPLHPACCLRAPDPHDNSSKMETRCRGVLPVTINRGWPQPAATTSGAVVTLVFIVAAATAAIVVVVVVVGGGGGGGIFFFLVLFLRKGE